MKISATLHHGPLKVEVESEKRKEVEENLLEVVGFLEENDDIFEELNPVTQTERAQYSVSETERENKGSLQGQSKDPGSFLDQFGQDLGVAPESIQEIVYIDSEGEEQPQLLIDGDQLGSNVPEKQRRAALIILLILETFYDKEEIKTAQFKEILAFADISDLNLHRAWDESLLKQSGKGSSATVELRGPGRRKARKLLKDVAESESE